MAQFFPVQLSQTGLSHLTAAIEFSQNSKHYEIYYIFISNQICFI